MLFAVQTQTHEFGLIHIEEIRPVSIDLLCHLGFRRILVDKATAQDTDSLQDCILSAGHTVGASAAHGLTGKGIISSHQHHAEPVGHHVCLFLRGKQHHQRYTGGTTGRIPEPIAVSGLFFLFFHPGTQIILGQKRQLCQIIAGLYILRAHTGFVKPFLIKRNLICLFHQFAHALILHWHDFFLVIRHFFLHFCKIQENEYIYQFSLQFIKHDVLSFVTAIFYMLLWVLLFYIISVPDFLFYIFPVGMLPLLLLSLLFFLLCCLHDMQKLRQDFLCCKCRTGKDQNVTDIPRYFIGCHGNQIDSKV